MQLPDTEFPGLYAVMVTVAPTVKFETLYSGVESLVIESVFELPVSELCTRVGVFGVVSQKAYRVVFPLI